MNPINYAVMVIKDEIPPEILRDAFNNSFGLYNHQQLSIEDNIISLVIRPRVVLLANLIGGKELRIPLAKVPYESIDAFNTVYHIPVSLTDGRHIVVVKNISFMDPYGRDSVTGNSCGQSALLNSVDALVNSAGPVPYNGSYRTYLIGTNTVLVRGQITNPLYASLEVTVTHDKDMNDLNPRNYPVLAEACLLACKGWIYNNYLIGLGEGRLKGGRELGEYKSVVDSYADANEMFREFRKTTLQRVLFMDDESRMENFMRSMMPPPI